MTEESSSTAREDIHHRFQVIHGNRESLTNSQKSFTKFENLATSLDNIKNRNFKIQREKNQHESLWTLEKLNHNRKVQKCYKNFFKKLQEEKYKKNIKLIKKWKERTDKMPKMKIETKRNLLRKHNFYSKVQKKLKTSKKKPLTFEQRIQTIKIFDFVWEKHDPNPKNFIDSREGCSFTLLPKNAKSDPKALIIGGRSHQSIPDIYEYSLNKNTFKKILTKNDALNFPRYNHSAVVYHNQIFIFGGAVMTEYEGITTQRILNEILVLNLENLEWTNLAQNAEFVPERMNHIAERIGHEMVIFGGEGENDQLLNDFWIFDLKQHTWTIGHLRKLIPARKGHSATLVIRKMTKIENLYKISKKFDFYDPRETEPIVTNSFLNLTRLVNRGCTFLEESMKTRKQQIPFTF
jgi:hypothetical protein